MDTATRRSKIIELLNNSDHPISASSLAEKLSVSRQVIVGDVAILRASGHEITATPRGYVSGEENSEKHFPYEGLLACKHITNEKLLEELYTIVDFGGFVIDVIIDHEHYGQLSGKLSISSRYEADLFMEKAKKDTGRPLSLLTGGVHLHTIGCPDREVFKLIKNALLEKGIIIK